MIYSNAGIVDIKTFDCIQIVLLNVCRMNYWQGTGRYVSVL